MIKLHRKFTFLIKVFTVLMSCTSQSYSRDLDNYDLYFSSEWAKEILLEEDHIVFKMSHPELGWDEESQQFETVNETETCVRIVNSGVNDVQNILIRDGLLERNIYTTINGEELFTGTDYSPSLSVEQIDIPSVYGKIPSFLYKKKDSEIKRVVVYIHGGSFESCIKDSIFRAPELHFLLNNETAVYAINTTGDADCKGKYPDYPDNISRQIDEWATSEIDDIFKAYDIISEKYPGKPIFLFGFSHGSYLTNLVASKYAKRSKFSGYISAFGAWDNSIDDGYSHAATKGTLAISDRHFYQDYCLECKEDFYSHFTYSHQISSKHGKKVLVLNEQLSHEKAQERLKDIRKNGNDIDMLYYQAESSFYKRTNPSLYISNIDKPFFSIHGDQDRNVYSVNSDILQNGLTESQKNHTQVYKYINEGHGVFTRSNFNSYTANLLKFISRSEEDISLKKAKKTSVGSDLR